VQAARRHDVEVTTAWGQPALKVQGKMFVCIASDKSAEPNSLVVMIAFADRDAAAARLRDHATAADRS